MIDHDALLDRALHHLAGGGYRGLSMRGLAREFGVSLASVQHRYATKDALWRAAIDRMVAQDEAAASVEGSFPDVMRRRMTAAATHPGLVSSVLADDAPGHEERFAYLAARLTPWLESARRQIAGATGEGLAREIDTEVLVATMLVGVSAIGAIPAGMRDLLGLGDAAEDRLADGVSDLLLFGIVARSSVGDAGG